MVSDAREQALPPGSVVDSFRVQSVLGIGGFGITYRAYDEHLHRSVALKEYFPSGLAARGDDKTTLGPITQSDAESFEYGLSRFLDEARTLAKFQQPNIVRVNRFLEANNTAYLVMDYEEGKTLDQVIKQYGQLTERQALAVSVHLLRGLREVHEKKFLHRDIKPANILIRRSGPPVLLDFGAARQALEERAGGRTVMLTPGYAPLEQYDSQEPQGPYTDLYALGATVLHALCGRAPPPATRRVVALQAGDSDPLDTAMAQLAESIDQNFFDTLYWMLRLPPSERPQTALELLDILAPVRETTARGIPAASQAVAPQAARPMVAPTLHTLRPSSAHPAPSGVNQATAVPARQTMAPAPGMPHEPGMPHGTAGVGTVAPAESQAAEAVTASSNTGVPVDEALLERAQAALAEHLGPIARVLVRRAAQNSIDKKTLIAALAAELDDDNEKRQFLNAMR
ncbi:MAG: protein kinase [Gammaproteobacteria bacterium]|nr:protein kinase [Gammaproteobacteria bacterium]